MMMYFQICKLYEVSIRCLQTGCSQGYESDKTMEAEISRILEMLIGRNRQKTLVVPWALEDGTKTSPGTNFSPGLGPELGPAPNSTRAGPGARP